MVSRRAVFLDRDGVLLRSNVVDGKAYAIRTAEEYELLPGVFGAIEQLKAHHFLTVMVTNQPDIDNGLVAREIVDEIHERLRHDLLIDAVYTCPHDKRRACECRKPRPGMLFQAKKALDIDLLASWIVGDRASDIAAGANVGCKGIFIDYNYHEPKPEGHAATVNSLAEAVQYILARK